MKLKDLPEKQFFLFHGDLFAIEYVSNEFFMCRQIANAAMEYEMFGEALQFHPDTEVDRVQFS